MTNEGAQRIIGPGEAFDFQPGHDGWVVGDEPCVFIEFHGVLEWGKPRLGARVLTTLLFTDLVGSTALAARLGDTDWQALLARHYDRVRLELERYRGEESKTTGDGFLALFDGTARAVRCAAAICQVARQDGLEVRVGVHSGEVECYPDSVQGVAVHVAARIMALAGQGEVLLSASTVALLEGSGLTFSDAGEHELKGLEGRRRLYRLAGDAFGFDSQAAWSWDPRRWCCHAKRRRLVTGVWAGHKPAGSRFLWRQGPAEASNPSVPFRRPTT